MRLWHKDLVTVLPRKQLIAQWRELCAIIGKIEKCGTPNHPLVNKVLDYPPIHFVMYTNLVLAEMHKRGYKVSEKAYIKMCDNLNKSMYLFNMQYYRYVPNTIHDIYRDWHNDRYYVQCYWNLAEKYDCGMIDKEEWEKIQTMYIKEVA